MLSSSFTAVDSRHAGVLLFLPGGGGCDRQRMCCPPEPVQSHR